MLLRGGRGDRGLKLESLEGGSFETRKTDIHTYISFCASSTLLHHVSTYVCRTYQI